MRLIYSGSVTIFEDDTTISKDVRRRPNISEDVRNNFEVRMEHNHFRENLQKSEISGKVSASSTHFTLTFLFFHWFEFQYFCVSFNPEIAHTFQPGGRNWSVIFQPADVGLGRHNDGVNELAYCQLKLINTHLWMLASLHNA